MRNRLIDIFIDVTLVAAAIAVVMSGITLLVLL